MKNIRPQLTTLANGVRVLGFPLAGTDSITTSVLVGIGSHYEEAEVAGISHFLEHLFFKGTKKRPTPRDIAVEIESVGGQFNAATSFEETFYYIKTASHHFELGLEVLADILQNSLFAKKQIEKERGVILEEIRMYNDVPQRRVSEDFWRLLYGDQPAGRSIAGSEETVSQITREQIIQYFQKTYFPQNLVVSVAGNFQPTRFIETVERYFGTMTGTAQSLEPYYRPPKSHERVFVRQRQTEQAHFVLGAEGTSLASQDREAVALLMTVLGQGMGSRLFTEIREKRGWAYYVGSFNYPNLKTGVVGVRAGVVIKNTAKAVRLCVQEFEKVAREGVSAQELAKAKEQIKGSLLLELEDSAAASQYFGSNLLLENKIETLQEYFARIDHVTNQEIQQAANKYLALERLHLAVIGPFQKKGQFMKLLK